jgi:hypothetical protein
MMMMIQQSEKRARRKNIKVRIKKKILHRVTSSISRQWGLTENAHTFGGRVVTTSLIARVSDEKKFIAPKNGLHIEKEKI